MKVSPETKKSTEVFCPYCGAFEQLIYPRRGAFAGLFSKNPNAQGWARAGGRTLLEMTDALFNALPFFIIFKTARLETIH